MDNMRLETQDVSGVHILCVCVCVCVEGIKMNFTPIWISTVVLR